MKNKIIAMFTAFTICFLSLSALFFGGSSNIVSALSVNENYYYNIDSSMARVWIDALKNNSSWPSQISRDDFYCCLMFDNSQSTPVLKRIVIIDKAHSMTSSNSLYSFIAPTSYYIQSSSLSISTPSGLESLNLPYWAQGGAGRDIGVVAYDGHYFMTYVNASYAPEEQSISFPYASITIPSFEDIFVPPEGYLTGAIVGFDFSVDAFYDWLIDSGKYLELPSYIGSEKLKSFLEFYKEWGGSNQTFVNKITTWLDYFNIVSQSLENRNILKSTIDELYREYRSQAFVTVYPNFHNTIHHRNGISTVTDDDNTTLVTDDVNDDTVTSILRDILRGIIYIPTALFNSTELLIDKFDNLSYDVIVSNNGGASDLSVLYNYDSNDFDDDFYTFETNVSSITAVPLSYVQTINNNTLMPENMLSDKQNLSVTIPVISGFTVNEDCSEYVTNTDTYTLNSTDYPWLDTVVKKMKRFASIMLIIGYLIHLRFKIADIVRGE